MNMIAKHKNGIWRTEKSKAKELNLNPQVTNILPLPTRCIMIIFQLGVTPGRVTWRVLACGCVGCLVSSTEVLSAQWC